MTTSTAAEVARRTQLAPATSFADDLQHALKSLLARSAELRFPNPKYEHDPVGFFRQILGIEPWSKQIEIIEAVRDHRRVAVCSGHKIGKSACIAGLALWFYCSFRYARVIMSSTTSRQVDQILWREVRMMRARGGRCLDCKRLDPDGRSVARPCPHSALIDGEQGELARTGLKSDDFREVVGFTAREAEAVAGISGQHLLYLIDEASGVADMIYEAIEGNRAGGARIALLGNGTRNEGEFFAAFTSKSHLYKTLRVSSEETPNVVSGELVIPGLATREWCEEKKIEWGVESPLYRVRVLGEHATNEEGKIFSLHAIGESEQRWHTTPDAGRLYIGIDPAGEAGTGDETVICVRRGLRVLSLRAHLGLNAQQHLVHLLALLQPPLLLPRETAVVVIDREGSIGARLDAVMRQYLDEHEGAFEFASVLAHARAVRRPIVYDRIRDELAANLEAWMRDGGAIVEDSKLEAELHALEWTQAVNGRLKVTPKDEIRKRIGRSCDRYDALALACWEPLSLRNEGDLPLSAQHAVSTAEQAMQLRDAPQHDPYAGASIWDRR